MLVPSVRASAMMASANEMGSIAHLVCWRAGDTDDGCERWRRMMTGDGGKMEIVGGVGFAAWVSRRCMHNNVGRFVT